VISREESTGRCTPDAGSERAGARRRTDNSSSWRSRREAAVTHARGRTQRELTRSISQAVVSADGSVSVRARSSTRARCAGPGEKSANYFRIASSLEEDRFARQPSSDSVDIGEVRVTGVRGERVIDEATLPFPSMIVR